jgi:putative tryptophan/tyrosine transport system substrate-binding protein
MRQATEKQHRDCCVPLCATLTFQPDERFRGFQLSPKDRPATASQDGSAAVSGLGCNICFGPSFAKVAGNMRRRDFMLGLGAAAALPLSARAQHVPTIGLLSMGASRSDPANFRPFLEQMQALGYIEGQNLIFDRRFAGGDDSLITPFAADLVRRPVDIIVATGTREALAAKEATSSIPIVTFVHPDPIGMGLAESLARPGGNLTGLTTMDVEIYGKRIEILKQAVPTLKKAGVLISGRQPQYKRDSQWANNFAAAAQTLGVELDIVDADERNLDRALAELAARAALGLVVSSDGIYVAHRSAVAKAALQHRLPTIFVFRQQVQSGGLLAYAANTADLSRRAAFFVDRILKGAKPADLPIEQPTKFDLVINLKTARALGLEVPITLLAQADEVIE